MANWRYAVSKESEARKQREKRELDDQLERELLETFPASDPPKITRTGTANRSNRSARTGGHGPD